MKTVQAYYRTRGSRWGYKLLLKGIRHCGYYPAGKLTSHSQAQINMMDIVGEGLNLKAGARVLDAGCGEGKTALHIAKNYGFRVSGVDLLPESIKIAQIKSNQIKSNDYNAVVDFKVGDNNKLPFKDNFFDGLYALESLIHASNPETVLREFKRVLKPGGHLVIADYTCSPQDDMPKKYQEVGLLAVEEMACPGLAIIHHDYYQQVLPEIGYTKAVVTDMTNSVIPMLRWFWQLSFIPFQFVRLFKGQTQHINSVAAYYGFKLARERWWRYVIVEATKQ